MSAVPDDATDFFGHWKVSIKPVTEKLQVGSNIAAFKRPPRYIAVVILLLSRPRSAR